jgi:hypothetical protein
VALHLFVKTLQLLAEERDVLARQLPDPLEFGQFLATGCPATPPPFGSQAACPRDHQ